MPKYLSVYSLVESYSDTNTYEGIYEEKVENKGKKFGRVFKKQTFLSETIFGDNREFDFALE